MPANPINGRKDVRIVRGSVGDDREAVTEGTAGWVYDVDTGRIWLDATGAVPQEAGPDTPAEDDVRWMDL